MLGDFARNPFGCFELDCVAQSGAVTLAAPTRSSTCFPLSRRLGRRGGACRTHGPRRIPRSGFRPRHPPANVSAFMAISTRVLAASSSNVRLYRVGPLPKADLLKKRLCALDTGLLQRRSPIEVKMQLFADGKRG